MCVYLSFFFFSSRRRHTRFDCDWSSDVCSSDLLAQREGREDLGGEDQRRAKDREDEHDPLPEHFTDGVPRDGENPAHDPFPFPELSARTKCSSSVSRRGSTVWMNTSLCVRSFKARCRAGPSTTRISQRVPSDSTRCPAARSSAAGRSGNDSTAISHSRTPVERRPGT